MNKKDDVKGSIKRLTQIPNVKREKYQPEYVRLGLEPPEVLPVKDTDFRYAFSKRKDFVTSSDGKKDNPVEPPRVAVNAYKEQKEIPRQMQNVNSGFNHEHTWIPTAEYYDEETIPPDAVNEELYPYEGKTNQQLDEESSKVASGSINYDEVKLPQERVVKQDNRQYHRLLDLTENQYCIAVDGNIVHISEDLNQIENMVEYILFDSESPLGDVSIESIAVFRRLSLKAGILVVEAHSLTI